MLQISMILMNPIDSNIVSWNLFRTYLSSFKIIGLVLGWKSEYFKKQNFILLSIKFMYLISLFVFSSAIFISVLKLTSSINSSDLVVEKYYLLIFFYSIS